MKKNYHMFKNLIKNKIISIPIFLTAICSYGFYITHYSIGLDDTSVARYYVEGRAPAMGRYTMYLLERIFKVASFSPFILEFINILFLMLAAIIWIALFRKIMGEKIPVVVYSFFACVFISFPLLNEIFVYYVHGSPGISFGYALTAFATLSIYTYIEHKEWKRMGLLFCSVVCVYFALGLYESFALVYIMSCSTVLFLYTLFKEEKLNWRKIVIWISVFILPILCAIILRSITFEVLSFIVNLPNHMRGLSDFTWLFSKQGNEQLHRMFIEFFGMYGINAFFYLPIRNYIISMILLFVYVIVKIVRRRNGWIAIGALGIFISPWLLMPIEGVVTTYRANLGLAFACAVSMMLIFYEIYHRFKFKWIIILFATVIVYNQSFDLNQWFYLEHIKYEYQVELTNQIYYQLATEYDLTKKIVFIGDVKLPDTFAKYNHILYESKDYKIIQNLEEKMEIKLSARFFDDNGYVYNEVPDLFLYDWGQDAFEEGSTEITKFFAMHGYEILPCDLSDWYAAKALCKDEPCFPMKGSIIEFEEYIVVKLATYTY